MKMVRRIGFVLVACILLVSGCCNNPQEYHYPIPEHVLAMNPYGASSTFYLRDPLGSLIRVQAISEDRHEVQLSQCSSCCATEYQDEQLVYFQSDSALFQAVISITQTGVEGEFAPAHIGITINNNGIFYADFEPDGVCRQQNGLGCLDSLVVGSQTYHDVMEFRNQSSNNGPLFPDRLHFNATDGILQFTTYDGKAWQLIH